MSDYKTIELSSGKKVVFEYSDWAQNPRDINYTDCNLTKMVCFHRRYNLGDEHNYDKENVLNWKELKQLLHREENICIIEPLYMFDHSGQSISTTPFSCEWDSGQVGYVFITKGMLYKHFNVKRISKKLKARAWKYLENEVETYNQYIEGDVYNVVIKDEEDCIVDSCCGYYGSDFKNNGAFDIVQDNLTPEEYVEFEKLYDGQ